MSIIVCIRFLDGGRDMAKKHHTSAGSFYIGEKLPKKLTSHIHYSSSSDILVCGGGNALSEGNVSATAKSVAAFIEHLGWSKKVSSVVYEQLHKMKLSKDPKEHARNLHSYYKDLGVQYHRAIIDDIETGKSEKVVQDGDFLDWMFGDEACAACADARHVVKGKAVPAKQHPEKGFYFGQEPVEKITCNQQFTIAGLSPSYVHKVLLKSDHGGKLSKLEKHNLAAVALSAYYFIHHKWPYYEQLELLLRNPNKARAAKAKAHKKKAPKKKAAKKTRK
jgi:hypothetical protein